MRRFSISVLAVLLWLVTALVIDRELLAPHCAACAAALALDLKVTLPAAELAYPPVSILVLVGVPMIALAIYLVPWRQLREPDAWREGFVRWCQPWFWLVIAVVLTVVGECLFLVVKAYLPRALTEVAEKLSVTATISVFKDYKPFSMTASLSGFVGLGLGTCLFLTKGMSEIFKWPSNE